MRDRPGERARRELRLAWQEAARSHSRILVFGTGIAALVGLGLYLQPLPSWVRGYELGAWTALTAVVMTWIVYIASGTHGRHLGKMGEECTADAVLGWRRRRRGWELINGLYFKGHGDVDHVLVGPGGVFAFESKWTSHPCAVDAHGITGVVGREPVCQARIGAQKIEGLLRYGKDRLDVSVHPVVALWGPGAPSLPDGHADVDGVLVCEGRRQRRWLKELDRLPLSPGTASAAKSLLRAQRKNQVDTAI
jgi:hypothetical protein